MGMLAIILGAFGAHALKKLLSEAQLVSFETGVRYQMYHALFLLFIASSSLIDEKRKNLIFKFTLSGVFLFSGSIYLLSCYSILPFDFRSFGFVTPIGGLFLILAWSILIFDLIRSQKKEI